ncbi:hypothetical protein LTR84_011584 [Exophiala bonariae]|uniref:Uncharacterized protein n=1 Tax=Exophiala bonariae TaxID=1690606 RepID=A0AAV9NGV5_9EURO|nr:hypothetical protein LTR84_011584 [Exophiala bonariae]
MAAYVGSSAVKLAWVNHDAQNMKAAPNRVHVFQHIQGSYRKWKKRQDNQSLAASAKVPGAILRSSSDNGQHPICDNSKTRNAILSTSISTNSSHRSNPCHGVVRRQFSPLTILQHGNSDPFSVFSVEITPQVNSMLSFYRTDILTALCHVDLTNGFTNDIVDKTWQTQVESLKDPGHSYALVASAAAVASRTATTSHYLDYAAACRLKSIHYLKGKLAAPDSFLNFASMEHINSACEAEIYVGNMTGARAHMRWLRRQFEKFLEREPLNRMMLVQLANDFYLDVQIAMTTMQRTSFDVHNWVPRATADAMKFASQCLPAFMQEVSEEFNAAIDSELQRLLLDRRKAGKLWLEKSDEPVLQPELVYFHALMIGGLHFGRMLDRYLTYQTMDASAEHSLTQIHLQQHLSLSVLYWMYLCGREVHLHERLLFDGTSLLLQHLRDSVASASRHLTSEECTTEYNETKLYALYTGAFSEHRQRTLNPEPARAWFNEQLAQHAISMGKRTWPEVEAVVATFLYYSPLEPSGSQWFQNSIDIHLESRVENKPEDQSFQGPLNPEVHVLTK